ncbi:acyl-CoA dehydrogenase [Streptomyces sp. x-19]|uniref:acyl-CoA dehydrogenase n=1 Tax=Streptomyces sp. x-19 TaxID=2789280 RepID=UPI00397EE215
MEPPPASPVGVGTSSDTAPGPAHPQDASRATAERFVALVDGGSLRLPLPGSGRTRERFHTLCRLGRHDLCVARLAEGHVDAVAILAELGGPKVKPGERWGVWAAHPPGPGLKAVGRSADWRLTGVKPYCSGARTCTHALVTADTAQGRRLFAVPVGDRGVLAVPGTWQAVGMAGSDSLDVTFHDVPAEPVGDVGGYVRRPGFQHGGIGVAACWLGGAQAVTATLATESGRRGLDEHAAAHLGRADVLLHTAEVLLGHAADEIDGDPDDRHGGARVRSLRVRGLVELVCTEVLQHVGRATGAGPLCRDAAHARAVADLTVYLRQHHAERDYAVLGNLLAGDGRAP